MITCAKISANVVGASCSPAVVGIEPELVLINFDDIESVTMANNVISGITLATGQKGAKYESAKNAFEASAALAAGTYMNKVTHQVIFRIFLKTQAIKDELDKMLNARLVAIVKNLDKATAEVRYEVYGLEAGLVLSDLQSNSTDTDGVIYTGTLGSEDGKGESSLPKSFFTTDYDTTKAAVDALVA